MDTRKVEHTLSVKYGYKKLPDELAEKYHNWYQENTPDFLKNTNHKALYTLNGSLLCSSYERVVVGDYGAFVEFGPAQASENTFVVAPGQEYRIKDPRYSKNIKYEWYTVNDGSNVKIYKQKRRVTYADYLPGMYYVSVHEVKEGNNSER